MVDKTRNQLAYCKRHIWGAQRAYLQFGQSRQRFRKKGRLIKVLDDLTAQGQPFEGIWLNRHDFCIKQI